MAVNKRGLGGKDEQAAVNKRSLGGQYEQMAAEYLEKAGMCILEKNFRCRMGEIDLIAGDGEYLVFVEVKYRSDNKGGGPLAAVDYKKQRQVSKVARYYLMTRRHSMDVPCRFDVIGITPDGIEYIKNAFDYRE